MLHRRLSGVRGLAALIIALAGLPTASPADRPDGEKKPAVKTPDDVTFHTAIIISEGTRMAAEVFAPKNPKSDKLPTIVMSHGWGGTAAALRPDAI